MPADVQLDDLYRDVILDHYRSPRGKKPLEHADVQNDGMNPVCGDEVTVQLCLHDGHVCDTAVLSRGCSISVASGSMMAEVLKGLTPEQAAALAVKVRNYMKSEAAGEELPGDLDVLEGLRKFPVRVKCALLPWTTMADALTAYASGKHQGDAPTSTEE